ncbi:hypothetical protein SBA3_510012 [Candidatus Sulfopaludibacter sp. SbA3]|nr:hypothetical protein SBA3_510012 [Candidatus Sulfopaludibacter sp. SbA3]
MRLLTWSLRVVSRTGAGRRARPRQRGLHVGSSRRRVITSATYGQGASIGDFIDFLTPQFLLYGLPPKDVWTQTFDASTSAGLGSHARGDVYAEGLRALVDPLRRLDVAPRRRKCPLIFLNCRVVGDDGRPSGPQYPNNLAARPLASFHRRDVVQAEITCSRADPFSVHPDSESPRDPGLLRFPHWPG